MSIALGSPIASGSTVRAGARQAGVATPLGALTLVRDGAGLTGLYYPGHWTNPDRSAFGPSVDAGTDAVFAATAVQLGEYFAGQRHAFDLPLNPHGSARARQLWQLLAGIPYGRTVTYGWLAAQLGQGISPRAVGGLVGHNPLSIIVPCHRVLGATGKLTGYAGGLERKQQLLRLEQAMPAGAPLW